MTTPTTRRKIFRIFLAIGLLAVMGAASLVYFVYSNLYVSNVNLRGDSKTFVYISTGSTFEDVKQTFTEAAFITKPKTFEWAAGYLDYTTHVKPGKYEIRNGMSNLELIGLLRSGRQSPVRLVFSRARTPEQFASVVARQIEADSVSIVSLLTDSNFLSQQNLNPQTALTLFIPNTYEFYWNTSAQAFFKRMKSENEKFWNSSRKEKAQSLGMDPVEVSILASIVEQETSRNDEKPAIAGVYINRLRKNWKLEADPTLIFALGNFGIRRVLNIHKETNSPYNTYRHEGLPPGPICIPSIASIDAVLNHQDHNYMFFCARDDFSGYHSFSRTYAEHMINARKFQNELNRRKIRS